MHISRITKKTQTSSPRTKNIDSRNTEKNKSLFTIHANQKCPFTLHEKSIEDPLKFGKNRPDSCRISETFFSYVSLNLSEYFGIRCVRIPVLMFRVFISAGDQVAIAQYSSPNSEKFSEIFGFLPPKRMQHFENPLWWRIRGSQVCQPQDMLLRSYHRAALAVHESSFCVTGLDISSLK